MECQELLSDETLCQEFEIWNSDYKRIIPLDMSERNQRRNEIDILDKQGMLLAKKLADTIDGGAKIKYYSEGLLKYLEQPLCP